MQDASIVVHLIDFSGTDDPTLQDDLAAEGFIVATLTEDQIELTLANRTHPDMILLRLARDGSRGLALCHHLRKAFPHCAMCLIHEGLGEWEETIALELGADAVMFWPVETRRIIAQIRAFQRLKRGIPSLQVPRLQLLAGSRTVRANGAHVNVTDAEYDLLSVLAEQAGHAVSRDAISRQMRGFDHKESDRAIDLRIARIRQKLGDSPNHPVYIRTVRGAGYMLIVDEV